MQQVVYPGSVPGVGVQGGYRAWVVPHLGTPPAPHRGLTSHRSQSADRGSRNTACQRSPSSSLGRRVSRVNSAQSCQGSSRLTTRARRRRMEEEDACLDSRRATPPLTTLVLDSVGDNRDTRFTVGRPCSGPGMTTFAHSCQNVLCPPANSQRITLCAAFMTRGRQE